MTCFRFFAWELTCFSSFFPRLQDVEAGGGECGDRGRALPPGQGSGQWRHRLPLLPPGKTPVWAEVRKNGRGLEPCGRRRSHTFVLNEKVCVSPAFLCGSGTLADSCPSMSLLAVATTGSPPLVSRPVHVPGAREQDLPESAGLLPGHAIGPGGQQQCPLHFRVRQRPTVTWRRRRGCGGGGWPCYVFASLVQPGGEPCE